MKQWKIDQIRWLRAKKRAGKKFGAIALQLGMVHEISRDDVLEAWDAITREPDDSAVMDRLEQVRWAKVNKVPMINGRLATEVRTMQAIPWNHMTGGLRDHRPLA